MLQTALDYPPTPICTIIPWIASDVDIPATTEVLQASAPMYHLQPLVLECLDCRMVQWLSTCQPRTYHSRWYKICHCKAWLELGYYSLCNAAKYTARFQHWGFLKKIHSLIFESFNSNLRCSGQILYQVVFKEKNKDTKITLTNRQLNRYYARRHGNRLMLLTPLAGYRPCSVGSSKFCKWIRMDDMLFDFMQLLWKPSLHRLPTVYVNLSIITSMHCKGAAQSYAYSL